MTELADLTTREQIAVTYISGVMDASAFAVGKTVIEKYGVKGGSGYSAVGAGLLGAIRRKGIVMRSAYGWRLTSRGRELAEELRPRSQP